ncbi:DUF982 domain-containing protein [Rhizobium sp. Root1220]|uniref:DUF982 domain-containing protein n=1 Tax=Rhizobium sp. Root1220 TaxID=1736432 RepID=UPI0006FE21FD|nr:DUF982 domain-containing protein [Rhizobium sp. Root1220]KQV63975.1 hypothetical protein ASC90_18645 [Rhizobium sp. Root1220]
MENARTPVPILPLHVEFVGARRCREAHSVDDLAALLLGEDWPQAGKSSAAFHRALVTALEAMESYVDASTARAAFVEAAHAAGIPIFPDDTAGIRKAS